MKPADDREEVLLREALQRAKGPEREAFLNQACAGNGSLCARLAALLQARENPDPFLEPPAAAPGDATVLVPPEEGPGTLIGRYKILEKIGEGGFGVVYVAEQREPVKRRVALKVIKLGMDTRQVVARFEAERQALALMDHPNIAKVLDAGATDTGRPFFVMELVKGIPITKYCDQEKLGTRERLDLFIKVCHAIQHAHQKGIIHRDIKPSNILVTLHDGVPVPKVIDFGIAKATQQELTEKTVYTQFQQFIGTPAYMSPEQAEMSGLDIDTRSDIYSLGVLLYELLTGSTPFDTQELLKSGLDEMRKIIREREPVRPSTRLTQELSAVAASRESAADSSGQDGGALPRRRYEELKALIGLLRGDLDWIVMKCLEKDRTRRYETANAVALDIERHLNHEPVVAHPPSFAYRLQKSFRRNKLVFTAAGAVALALVLGVVVSTWQAIRATKAGRREAEAHLRADEAAHLADSQRDRAEKGEQKAKASELAAREKAYASDMNLAQQALAADNLGRARDLLYRQLPQAAEKDLRGWEWRYLWQRCQSDALYSLCQKSNEINSLAVSHDGNWLAVGEQNNGGLSVWDLRTRQETARLPSGDPRVVAAFSPEQPLLAFSTATGVTSTNLRYGVRFWDARSGRIVEDGLALAGQCRGLAFAGDGRTLLTCTTDDRLARWEIPGGKCLATWPVANFGEAPPFPLAMTQDGRLAALVTRNGGIRVFDLLDGRDHWTAKPPELIVTALTFSPDGKILVSGAGYVESSIRFWDVPSGRQIGRPLEDHRAWVSTLVFWPDGKTLASASADQTIRLWDLSDMSHVQPLGRPLRGHRLEVWRLALLPDQKTLVSGCKDGSVCVWDTTAIRRERIPVTLPPRLWDWCFGASGDSVITVDQQGQVARWRGTDFQETQPLAELGTNPFGFCWSGAGRLLAAGSTNGVVRVWDLEKRTVLKELTSQTLRRYPWMFMPQGRKLAIFHPDDGTLHIWDLTTWKETQSWSNPALPSFATGAFSPDERWCLLLDWDGASSLIEMATGRNLNPNLNLRQSRAAAFSPDGKLFAGASMLGFARLWKTAPIRKVATLGGFLLGVDSLSFSPDGRRLAVGSNGREAIKLWDLDSLQELLTLEGEGSQFNPTAFSPDGNALGSRSRQGVLHLWRAPSWAEIDAAEARDRKEAGAQ